MSDDHDATEDKPGLFGWNRTEWRTLALAVGALVGWGLSIALFGVVGLIVPALALVAGSFVMMLLISRG